MKNRVCRITFSSGGETHYGTGTVAAAIKDPATSQHDKHVFVISNQHVLSKPDIVQSLQFGFTDSTNEGTVNVDGEELAELLNGVFFCHKGVDFAILGVEKSKLPKLGEYNIVPLKLLNHTIISRDSTFSQPSPLLGKCYQHPHGRPLQESTGVLTGLVKPEDSRPDGLLPGVFVRHGCATESGSSGSIIYDCGTPDFKPIALHKGSLAAGSGVNVAARMDVIYPAIHEVCGLLPQPCNCQLLARVI